MYGKIRKQRTETGYFLTKVFLKGWSDTTKACIGSIFGCNVSPVSRSRWATGLQLTVKVVVIWRVRCMITQKPLWQRMFDQPDLSEIFVIQSCVDLSSYQSCVWKNCLAYVWKNTQAAHRDRLLPHQSLSQGMVRYNKSVYRLNIWMQCVTSK